jgi:hypothetical protein
MRIQSEYMSFNNRWTISSSYDFQAHLPHSRLTCRIPGVSAAFPKRMFFPECSQTWCWRLQTSRRRSQTCHQRSQTCCRHSQVHPKFSPAHRGVSKHITITPMVLLNQSSEISVTLKAGRNALLQSDTLLKLPHPSSYSTSSQTLLEASRD